MFNTDWSSNATWPLNAAAVGMTLAAVAIFAVNRVDPRADIDDAMEGIAPLFPNKPVKITQRVSYSKVRLDTVSNGRLRNCSRFLSQEKRWRPSHILIAKSWHETCPTSIL
jgi:hypothetical protein